MRRSLLLHPSSHTSAVRSIDVAIERPSAHLLSLRYVVSGNIAGIATPAPGDPARADELWRHTCFEAFARQANAGPYCEFNFAPSRQWAAYAFEAERRGRRVATEMNDLKINVKSGAEILELAIELSLNRMAELSARADWQLALSAVIEEMNGNKSYWALAHPEGRPDFHHSDCFALDLPSALPT
jgi:hypothetical protein